MRFLVDEARNGRYKEHTGKPLPTAVEFETLAQLMAWVEMCGNSIVLDPSRVEDHGREGKIYIEPTILVYNDYLE
jgi:hypothetical protein